MATTKTWQVAVVLLTLQARGADSRLTFNEGALAAWAPALRSVSAARAAIDAMARTKLIELAPEVGVADTAPLRYRLTSAGCEAVQGARKLLPSLHKAAHGPMTPADQVEPFAGRLWKLLCIRKVLTAEEAANLLLDAGQDVSRARTRASELLLAWSRQCPLAIQVSDKRVKGAKRYGLMVDLGPTPPDLRGKGRSRAL